MPITYKQLKNTLPNRRTRLKTLWIASAVNTVLLAILYLAETRVAERMWLTGLATYAPQVLFAIPLGLLLIWSIIERRRLPIATNTAIAVIFAFTFMGFNVPLGRLHGGRAIRVMTYNVHQGERGIREIANVIDDLHPDIVCLQEVNSWGKRGDPVWQLQQLLPGWHVERGGEIGTLSRYPIISSHGHFLPSNTGRAISAVTVRIHGRDLTVLTTHFNLAAMDRIPEWYKEPARKRITHTAAVMAGQAWELIRVAGTYGDSVVITGDLNMPPRWMACREITSRYRDAFRAAGWGFGYTFSADLPVSRIDYILLGRAVGVRRCFVPRTRASDHRPVVADLILNDGE